MVLTPFAVFALFVFLLLILTGRCFRFGGCPARRRPVSGCATRRLLIRALRGRVALLSALG